MSCIPTLPPPPTPCRLNSDLKRQADSSLSKATRVAQFDIAKCIRTDTITSGLDHAISSGNWTIKRFRMDRKGVTQVRASEQVIACLWQAACCCAYTQACLVPAAGDAARPAAGACVRPTC